MQKTFAVYCWNRFCLVKAVYSNSTLTFASVILQLTPTVDAVKESWI